MKPQSGKKTNGNDNSNFKEEIMSSPQSHRSKQLTGLTDEIIKSIGNLADKLPDNESYYLRRKINACAGDAQKSIAKALGEDKSKIDIVRSMIKAETSLDECKEYLDLAQTLRYTKTGHITEKIDKLNRLIAGRLLPVEAILEELK